MARPECGDRLVVALEGKGRVGEVVVVLGPSRRDLDRAAEVPERRLVITPPGEGIAEVVVTCRGAGRPLQPCRVGGNRPVRVVEREQGIAEVHVSHRHRRLHGKGAAGGGGGLPVTAEGVENARQVGSGLGRHRAQRRRALEGLRRLVEPARRLQGVAEVDVGGDVLGRGGARPAGESDGALGIALGEEDGAQEVEGVRVVGHGPEDRLVEGGGLAKPTRPVKPDGLAEVPGDVHGGRRQGLGRVVDVHHGLRRVFKVLGWCGVSEVTIHNTSSASSAISPRMSCATAASPACPNLVRAIGDYLAQRNLAPERYLWNAKGADILAKIVRARAAFQHHLTA